MFSMVATTPRADFLTPSPSGFPITPPLSFLRMNRSSLAFLMTKDCSSIIVGLMLYTPYCWLQTYFLLMPTRIKMPLCGTSSDTIWVTSCSTIRASKLKGSGEMLYLAKSPLKDKLRCRGRVLYGGLAPSAGLESRIQREEHRGNCWNGD